MTRLYRLTRRELLIGAGAVGLASAGAGLGTSALFSDSEAFAGNSLTAGELDLLVHWESTYQGATLDEQSGVVDGGVAQAYTYDDWKPLDTGSLEFCFELGTNPGYLWLCGELTENAENGVNDPESGSPLEDDPFGPNSGDSQSGELADAIDAVLSYCDTDGSVIATIVSGSLRDVLDAIHGGIPLDYDESPGIATPGEQTPYEPSAEPGMLTGPCLCLDLALDSGNETQSDSVGFDLEFHVVQARNTDGTLNPCCEPVDTDLSTGIADWRVISSPDSTVGPAQVITPVSSWYPVSNASDPDVPADCEASWVNPYGGSGVSGRPFGDYVYELTFTVPSHVSVTNPCTLMGAFASDNEGDLLLDGSLVVASATGTDSFQNPEGYSVTVTTPGSHTLRAEVNNEGGPTGAYVCAMLTCPCEVSDTDPVPDDR